MTFPVTGSQTCLAEGNPLEYITSPLMPSVNEIILRFAVYVFVSSFQKTGVFLELPSYVIS